jgi:hypothetical protein
MEFPATINTDAVGVGDERARVSRGCAETVGFVGARQLLMAYEPDEPICVDSRGSLIFIPLVIDSVRAQHRRLLYQDFKRIHNNTVYYNLPHYTQALSCSIV